MKTDYAKVLKEAGRYDQVTDILVKIATGCNAYTYPVHPFIDDDFTTKWRVEGSSIRKQALRLLEIVVDKEDVKVIDEMSFTQISAYVESHADILLHNYAINVSHKIEPDVDMDEARNWLVLGSLIKGLHLPEEWAVSDGWKFISNDETTKTFLWQVSYLVDNGYDWDRRVCIIRAVDEKSADVLLGVLIEPKLKGTEKILHNFTKIKKCEDNAIIYHDIR